MRSTAPSLAVVLVVLACRGPAPPILTNASPRAPACPTASAVFGPAQEADADTWDLPLGAGTHRLPKTEPARRAAVDLAHEITGDFLPPHRTWLLREGAAPCAVRVAEVNKRVGPADCGEFCGDDVVGYDAVLAGSCEEPAHHHRDDPDDPDGTGASPPMADDAHPPVVVNDGPPACRLSRPVELTEQALAGADLPEPVRRALEAARAQPRHAVTLSVTSAGRIAAIWQIGSFYLDAVTTDIGNSAENCPLPIWVFVRTPGGVVQLDTKEGVIGLLADDHGPEVVLTGRYGRADNVAFDVARLPPHRPAARSWSSESCIR